jgi:kynurenine formamidase
LQIEAGVTTGGMPCARTGGTDLKLQSIALGIFAAVCIAKSAFAVGAALDPSKIVDLSYTFDATTIYWPTEHPFVHEFEHYGPEPGGYFYAAAKYAAPEHGGTHMDAPVHFNRNGMTVDQVPLSEMVGPAVVIDFSTRAATNRDTMLTVDDIKKWEAAHGPLPEGAIVVARSGWGRFWPDKKHYLGTDRPGDVAHLRFPGYSPQAIDFLLKNRKVSAIAIDTASIDPGNSKDFPVHRHWLGANKPALENVANADKLPETGATLYCIPMKIGKGTGAPTRIFAILP